MEKLEILDFFEKNGGLHDCLVTEAKFSEKYFEIKVDDINKNFVGLDEYIGPKSATIRCVCVDGSNIEMNISKEGKAGWISDCLVDEIGDGVKIIFRFINGGYIKLLCDEVFVDS